MKAGRAFHTTCGIWADLWDTQDSEGHRLLRQGEVTGLGISKYEKEHGGAHLQLRLDAAARNGPPVVCSQEMLLKPGKTQNLFSLTASSRRSCFKDEIPKPRQH